MISEEFVVSLQTYIVSGAVPAENERLLTLYATARLTHLGF